MNVVRTDVQPELAGIHPGISEADYRLAVRAAMLYHQAGLTQSEIGARLGYSRIKVNRVLSLARSIWLTWPGLALPPVFCMTCPTKNPISLSLPDW